MKKYQTVSTVHIKITTEFTSEEIEKVRERYKGDMDNACASYDKRLKESIKEQLDCDGSILMYEVKTVLKEIKQ